VWQDVDLLAFRALAVYLRFITLGCMLYYSDLKGLSMTASGNSQSTAAVLWSNVSWVCVRFGVVRLTGLTIRECSVHCSVHFYLNVVFPAVTGYAVGWLKRVTANTF
jgi:hypothetical protein